MGLFDGKKGVIMGIANEFSIAAGIAKYLSDEGAELAFNHLPDKEGRDRMAKRLARVADPLNTALKMPCDITKDEDITAFWAAVKEKMGTIDFFIHSIAYAPIDDIKADTVDVLSLIHI